MPSEQPLFSLKDVRCRRGGRTLFKALSLDLAAGAVVRLAGPNGAGKSSLLRAMAGRLPVMGDILWQDINISETEGDFIAFLPSDDRALKVLETCAENLSFWRDDPAAVTAALQKSGMEALAETPVRFLSAGQKRRLSVARVYLQAGARLWLLDEPLNGLDTASQEKFLAALAQHAAGGGIAVIAAHQDILGAQVLTLEPFVAEEACAA